MAKNGTAKGIGRPSKGSEKLVKLNITVRAETKEAIERFAAAEARPASQVARFAIEDGLEAARTRGGFETKGRRRRPTSRPGSLEQRRVGDSSEGPDTSRRIVPT